MHRYFTVSTTQSDRQYKCRLIITFYSLSKEYDQIKMDACRTICRIFFGHGLDILIVHLTLFKQCQLHSRARRIPSNTNNILELDSLGMATGISNIAQLKEPAKLKHQSSCALSCCHLPLYTIDAFSANFQRPRRLRDILPFRAQAGDGVAVDFRSSALISSFLLRLRDSFNLALAA